jgi:hypothetical protein
MLVKLAVAVVETLLLGGLINTHVCWDLIDAEIRSNPIVFECLLGDGRYQTVLLLLGNKPLAILSW